jgi:DNA helicase-2/ATP-dependent DNA helicase PcrA
MSNKLIIAAAGSGKTTALIKESLKIKEEPVLVTTYTEANANEIRNKYIIENGCIPANINIQTWFSLLIKHGVKPYQSVLFDYKVNGMVLVNNQSGLRYKTRQGYPIYWGEQDNFQRHYFTKENKIYSDKLSKLVCRINDQTSGKVINRLVSIFPNIFIDECQDLAGYDLDIIKLFATNAAELILVCDPRQVIYLTHNERKYLKYRNGLIEDFINEECHKIKFEIDNKTFSHSHRCNQLICDYSNRLYPNFTACDSKQDKNTGHDGIFLVDRSMVKEYLEIYNPVQLRWNIANGDINKDYLVYNLGQSKGLTFERVLIYPTQDMIGWMKNHNHTISDEARAKFYVGITRAINSVGIVCDIDSDYIMDGIHIYE